MYIYAHLYIPHTHRCIYLLNVLSSCITRSNKTVVLSTRTYLEEIVHHFPNSKWVHQNYINIPFIHIYWMHNKCFSLLICSLSSSICLNKQKLYVIKLEYIVYLNDCRLRINNFYSCHKWKKICYVEMYAIQKKITWL